MKTKDQILDKKHYIGIIIGLIVVLLLMMPVFYINKIDVVNNNFYSSEEIIVASEVGEKHMLDFSYTKAEDKIEVLPYIEKADIKYIFPGKIEINIVEKKPFVYLDFMGSYVCVNENAQVIEQTNTRKHELPVVKGIECEKFIVGDTLQIDNMDKWLCVVKIIEYLQKYSFANKIEAIDVYDIEEIHLYVDNLDAIMGNIGDFDKKIKVLIKIHQDYDMGILDFRAYSTRGDVLFKPIT